MRVLALSGPPGAGKSTALIQLATTHPRLARFGVREYGLALAEAGDPLGLEIRELLLRGELLSRESVRREFAHFLARLPADVSALAVEGYPRDPGQCDDFAATVHEAGALLAGLIVVEVPDEVCRNRVVGRRICTRCGLPVSGADRQTCGSCGGLSAARNDDASERLETRLQEFRTVHAAVREVFTGHRLLYTVDGDREPAEVREHLRALLLPDEAAGPTAMMAARGAALDTMSLGPAPADARGWMPESVFLDVADRPSPTDSGLDIDGLAAAVTDLLVRDDGTDGPGVAVVTGLSTRFDVEATRRFHEDLFLRVWDRFRARTLADRNDRSFKVKVGVTADGLIPPELYGSRWSFKRLHADRDALLFSHLYGPAAGFTGGSVLVADVRDHLQRHAARFEDRFEWSDEPTPGSKPVLREQYGAEVLAACGLDLGALGPDSIVFVNNLPSAGVLHGVTPVAVTDEDAFIREFHRCSVKRVEL